MKINEVEQLVGITKKNIRFYEEQGLLDVKRSQNGYREYTEKDVELLLRIRLLRRLAVPIEEIRKVLSGRLTLIDCLERHKIYLNHEKQNLNLADTMCDELLENHFSLSDIPAESYLEKLSEMEKGGVRFLDVSKVDVGKKKRGARTSAYVMIGIVVLWEIFLFIGNHYDPIPGVILLLMAVPPLVVVGGIIIALSERMKEIDKGEADEAVNY